MRTRKFHTQYNPTTLLEVKNLVWTFSFLLQNPEERSVQTKSRKPPVAAGERPGHSGTRLFQTEAGDIRAKELRGSSETNRRSRWPPDVCSQLSRPIPVTSETVRVELKFPGHSSHRLSRSCALSWPPRGLAKGQKPRREVSPPLAGKSLGTKVRFSQYIRPPFLWPQGPLNVKMTGECTVQLKGPGPSAQQVAHATATRNSVLNWQNCLNTAPRKSLYYYSIWTKYEFWVVFNSEINK